MPEYTTVLYNPVTKPVSNGGLELLDEWVPRQAERREWL
jgi:hypothetical protein